RPLGEVSLCADNPATLRTGAATAPPGDRPQPLASLQLLQQLFRFGLGGERRARAEQRLERCLSVSSPAEPAEGYGQVILDIGAFRGGQARGAEVRQRLAGLALGQQDPSERVVHFSCPWSSGSRLLGQCACFRQIPLLLIKPRQIVQ